MDIEQGKYYLQRQKNNPHLGEILEMFHFRSEDEEGMTGAQVFYFIYDNGLSWDDAYYSSYHFEEKCVEMPKMFWDDWLHALLVIKTHVASFLKPYGVSEENVNDGVVIHAANDLENEDSPFLFINRNTYHFGDSVKEDHANLNEEDFDEIAVCVDRETVDVSIHIAKRILNEVKEQMKKVLNAPKGKYIPHICTDWGYDDDSNGRYKFTIKRSDHTLVVADKVVVRNLEGCEEQEATVDEVQDDGIILKTSWIDITDFYSIEKI